MAATVLEVEQLHLRIQKSIESGLEVALRLALWRALRPQLDAFLDPSLTTAAASFLCSCCWCQKHLTASEEACLKMKT